MQNIGSEQMITILGIFIMFALAFGIAISVRIKDRKERLAHQHKNERMKIMGHKEMLYKDESEETEYGAKDFDSNDDLIYPHAGIGSTHIHHQR